MVGEVWRYVVGLFDVLGFLGCQLLVVCDVHGEEVAQLDDLLGRVVPGLLGASVWVRDVDGEPRGDALLVGAQREGLGFQIGYLRPQELARVLLRLRLDRKSVV